MPKAVAQSPATLNLLLDAMVMFCQSFAFLDPTSGVLVPVVKRKLPRRAEVLDSPTQITICSEDNPDQVQYFAFQTGVTQYAILVTIISPNDQNMLANIDLFSGWREIIKKALLPPFTNFPGYFFVPGVWDMRVKPITLFDRGELNNNYDYQSLEVDFTSNN